jgi:CDP-diglyceride synthetase
MRGRSWWICGESVAGNCTESGPEKYANFLKYFCGFFLAMVRNGMGLQVGLGWWFLPVTLVVVFGTCAVYVGRIFGAMRGA